MLSIRNTEAIRQIEAAIGYTFNDKRLLVQVLTRKTYLKIDPEAPDNEVLEFYGDTLMNYHVTNYFMSKYAHMLDDGLFFMRTVEQFTDLRSHYVCNRYLTDRVKALGLARYLRAQNRDAELRRDSEKAYADIFESLVGAIYLDSCQNETLIRAFILRQLGIEPRRAPAEIEAFDYDTLLDAPEEIPAPVETEAVADLAVEAVEEDAGEVGAPDEDIPAAEEIPFQPAHDGMESPAEAAAVDTPATEAEEAETAEIPDPAPAAEETATEAAATAEPLPIAEVPAAVTAPLSKQEKLAALCLSLGYELPTYGETPPNAPNARPVAACTLKYKDTKGKLIKISLNDSGKTLDEATEKVAAKMLTKLEKQVADETEKRVKQAKKEELDKLRKQLRKENEPSGTETPAVAEAPMTADTPQEESVPAEVFAEIASEAVETAPLAEGEIPSEAEAVAEETAAEVTAAEVIAAEVTEPAPAEEAMPSEAAPAVVENQPAPAENTPVTASAEAPAEIPAEEIRAETVGEIKDEDAKPAEDLPPVAESKPAKKAPAKKRASTKKKVAPEETPTEVEATPSATPEVTAEPAPEAVPAEEIKPAKKAPSKKKAPPKKNAEATEEKPAMAIADVPTEAVNAEADEVKAEDKPTKATKPATRKPRAKKSEQTTVEGDNAEVSE